jgi:hypothetical protein
MIANAGPARFFFTTGPLVMAMLMATNSYADCVRDLYGEVYCGAGRCLVDRSGTVWCSRYYQGGATTTFGGQVLCGKGQCAKSSDGQIFCSAEIGGAVLRDSRGRVRCHGKCEPATADKCENTRADSAGG